MRTIAEIMSAPGRVFDSSRPVSEAIGYMQTNGLGSVLVSEGRRPVGILTERDVLLKLDFRHPESIASLLLSDVMSPRLISATPDISFTEALRIMRNNGIRNLPVIEEGEVVGMVSLRSLLNRYASHLEELLGETIDALTSAISQRDPYTADHQRRVALVSVGIARAMGLSERRIDGLRMAALTHDIGKIDVPIELLAKPGKLSKPEFELIKQHPEAGYAILGSVDFEQPVAEIVLQHHERMDGSGYPRALKGEDILPEARILGVADVFEAIMSFRPYRAALGIEAARSEIAAHAGSAFDLSVVEAFSKLLDDSGSGILDNF